MAIKVDQNGSIEAALESFDYEISLDPEREMINLSGKDVSAEIRSPRVAALVRGVATDPRVRQLQKTDARARIEKCDLPGIIVEGRDITTVVAPTAQVRILLTASEEVRLQRREKDQTEAIENLLARDSSDSTVAEFMKPSAGVFLLDTTDLNLEQSVQAMLKQIRAVQSV
jgi:cytidylate kinase